MARRVAATRTRAIRNARYDKYSLTLSYLQPFQLWGERFSFDSLATGRRSEDVLFSPQRISLGGNSSVRGFKDQTLTGDSGGYWRNQLRWRRAVEWAPLRPGCRNTAWPSPTTSA